MAAGRIFKGMTADFATLGGDAGTTLPAGLYFQSVESLPVTEIEECVTACNLRTDGSCQAFYLAADGVTCHLGSLVTGASGLGNLVSDVQNMFSRARDSVGKNGFICFT